MRPDGSVLLDYGPELAYTYLPHRGHVLRQQTRSTYLKCHAFSVNGDYLGPFSHSVGDPNLN